MATYENQVINDYFDWLYNYVCEGRVHSEVSYKKLFALLHSIEFTFSIRNDLNRARDGVDLRYRFAMLMNDERMMSILDGPCTILEMMVALAIKCETIMDDTRYGNRTGQWFWNMLSSLDISYMTDERFDRDIVENRIRVFLDREYDSDGRGGLFYIKGCKDDLRGVEIWTQLCWYLNKYD